MQKCCVHLGAKMRSKSKNDDFLYVFLMFCEKTATLVSTLRGPRCGPRAKMMILLSVLMCFKSTLRGPRCGPRAKMVILLSVFNDFYRNH